MYIFKTGIPFEEHDAFVKKSELANLLQSSSWAKIKDNWKSEIVGVYEEERLVASALVLIRPLPLGLTMLYTPRGPILDYTNLELLEFFLKQMKKFGRRKKAIFLKMDPTIRYRSFYMEDNDRIINADSSMKIAHLERFGAKWQGLTMDMITTVQPRFQANVYKENFSEEILSKKTRQMLRTARNKGVSVRTGGMEMIDEFARLMTLTEKRKGVSLRNADYYRKLLATYPNDSFVMLAELNLKELLEKSQVRLKENETQIHDLKENQIKKRHHLEELHNSLTREVEELSEKVETIGEKVIIAGTLSVLFGASSEILYAGMDESYKRYMPAYLTWFETICECFTRGANSSNMGGLEGSLNDGLLQFKNNFHPMIEEFVGEFDLPINPLLFKAAETAYKIKKRK